MLTDGGGGAWKIWHQKKVTKKKEFAGLTFTEELPVSNKRTSIK